MMSFIGLLAFGKDSAYDVLSSSLRHNTSGTIPVAVVKFAICHVLRRQNDDRAGKSDAGPVECLTKVTMPYPDPGMSVTWFNFSFYSRMSSMLLIYDLCVCVY